MGQYVPTRSEVLNNLWGPREIRFYMRKFTFILKSVFMVDVRFELTTNDPWSADDAIS